MSEQNDNIRRQLGSDMLEAERRANQYRVAKSTPKPDAVDPRKQQDEQCGVDAELLKGVVIGAAHPHLLPNGTQYFSSFEDFLAWCDSEGGATD